MSTVEREAEHSQLAALLATARSGRGQVCVIEGPSGIGKSRLLADCVQSAGPDMLVLNVRASDLTRDYAFGIARNLFEPTLLRVSPDVRARLLNGPAALAGPLIGDGEASDEFSVIHGLYWLTVNLAEERPLAVVVDDVHWADESSLRYLAYVAERLDDVPVALVVAVRTGDPGAASSTLNHLWGAASTTIRPAELSSPAVHALLAAALPDREVDAGLVSSVVQNTGGNPFLVVAVANALRVGEDAQLDTPSSVRRNVTRRLGFLGSSAGDLARAASVLGDDGALRTATRLARLHPDRGITAAEQLVAAQIFASLDPITFAHPIIRTAIYEGLAPGERPATHLRAAGLLRDDGVAQPEVIAEHLLLSTPTDDAWVLDILHEAGRAAARKGAPAAAVRYLQRAVHNVDMHQLPPAVLIDLGLAEAATGEATSLDRFEQALQLVSEPVGRADTLYSLGQTLYRFGRYADASRAFYRGAELFEDGDQQLRRRFEGAAWGAEYYLKPAQRETVRLVDGDGPGDGLCSPCRHYTSPLPRRPPVRRLTSPCAPSVGVLCSPSRHPRESSSTSPLWLCFMQAASSRRTRPPMPPSETHASAAPSSRMPRRRWCEL